MSLANWMRKILFCLALCAALVPLPLRACAACFGQSDSALAKGMNMGIFSLLAVVVTVLGGIAAFFVYLAKKAAAAPTPPTLSEPAK